jgi:molecular chaperone GrpE
VLTDDHLEGRHAEKGHDNKGHAGRSDRGGRTGGGPASGEQHAAGESKARHSRKGLEHKVEELTCEVERLGKELSDAKEKYLRALADFDNFRKRTARQSEERTRCANEDLITRLLEVVDNMERAVDASDGAKNVEGLRTGLELTYQHLRDLLTREGLCPIKCVGEKFDPNYHEAIMALEKEGADSESVIEEVQKGYTLGGKVIRPSKVVVSK